MLTLFMGGAIIAIGWFMITYAMYLLEYGEILSTADRIVADYYIGGPQALTLTYKVFAYCILTVGTIYFLNPFFWTIFL